MLKKFLWRQRTKPRTPTTKNGKFVITFNVLGTPVKHPDNKSTQISQKKPSNYTYKETYREMGDVVFGYRENCACQHKDGALEREGFWEWQT